MPTCLDCAWFAGRSRDRLAVLFRQGKGYCDNEGHHGGVWNVVQNIEKDKNCALFEDAPEEIKAQRRKAVELIRRKTHVLRR